MTNKGGTVRLAQRSRGKGAGASSWNVEVWVELSVGDWIAAYRLLPKDAGPVIAELRVFPAESGRHRAGCWSGEEAHVPQGGLPITILRDLRTSDVREFYADALRRFEKKHGASTVTRVLSRHGLGRRKLPLKRPGRRGHDPTLYAEVAARYVKAVRSGSRTPVRDVARELNYSQPQMRDLIHAARTRGMLTAAPQGRAGGELTPEAVEVLEQEIKKRKRRRRPGKG